jgi:hypothetical protein
MRRNFGSAIVIGLLAGLVFAASAQAVPGLERVDATSVSDSSTNKRIAAKCPAGKRVVGGGGYVANGGGQVVLQRLQPKQAATDDRFVVGANEDDTGFDGDWSATAYALCSDPLPGQQVTGLSIPRVSDGLQSQLALCPGTQTQIGFGGRIMAGAGQVHITDLFPFFDAPPSVTFIRAREDANGFDGIWSPTAYAVCADTPSTGFTQVGATSPSDSENKSATVSCPAGTQVHSAGGALLPGAANASNLIVDKVKIDPALSSVTVRGVEDENGTGDAWAVRANALCAP